MERGEKNHKKYAGQVVDVARSENRLSFTDRLMPMTDAEGDPYLNVFSAKSIYLATLFNFKQNRSLIANIPIRDLPLIRKRTDWAEFMMFQASFKPQVQAPAVPVSDGNQPVTEVSPAFSTLRMGNLAGKTPGDLLLSSKNPDKTLDTLRNQLKFLKERVAKYPGNQADIDAIEDALDCYSAGLLASMKPGKTQPSQNEEQTVPQGFSQCTIYKTAVKHQRKTDKATGKHQCYSIEVTCSPLKDSPYRVQIMNCYAPLKELSNGILPVDMKNAEQKQTEWIDLTEGEWLFVLERLSENMRSARNLWYAELRRKDESNRWSPEKDQGAYRTTQQQKPISGNQPASSGFYANQSEAPSPHDQIGPAGNGNSPTAGRQQTQKTTYAQQNAGGYYDWPDSSQYASGYPY